MRSQILGLSVRRRRGRRRRCSHRPVFFHSFFPAGLAQAKPCFTFGRNRFAAWVGLPHL